MRFEEIDPVYRGFVIDLLRRRGFDPEAFPLQFAPEDEMFFVSVLPGYPGRPGAAVYRYVESAIRSFEVYGQLADHLGGFQALDRVLDFGSGYGRLTRPLLQRLDRSKIFVSDIYTKAVAWQAATFGVNGRDSAPDPDQFVCEGGFSIVFAGSVFSHLPDELFQRWLKRLHGLVAPGGLLAFSAHGPAFAPPEQPIGADGIGYAPWSESDSLGADIYGMSYVTEAYVRRVIAEACGEAAAKAARRFECALYEGQDLYVIGAAGRDLSALDIRVAPLTAFTAFEKTGGAWDGYALDLNPGRQIVQAELFVGDELIERVTPRIERHNIMNFTPAAPNMSAQWSFMPRDLPAGSVLRARSTSSTGAWSDCYAAGSAPVQAGAVWPRS